VRLGDHLAVVDARAHRSFSPPIRRSLATPSDVLEGLTARVVLREGASFVEVVSEELRVLQVGKFCRSSDTTPNRRRRRRDPSRERSC
jgi:hypothetical protein